MSDPLQYGPMGMNPDGTPYQGWVPQRLPFGASNPNLTNPTPSLRSNRVAYLLNPTTAESTSNLYSTAPSSSRNSLLDAPDRRDSSFDETALGLTPYQPRLPHSSRRFERFAVRGDDFWSSGEENNGFFAPSYLRGSSYMTKLEEQHRIAKAHKELHPQSANGGAPPPESILNTIRTAASHMGISYDLVERIKTFDHSITIPTLPTRLNIHDRHGALDIASNGLELKYSPALRTTREQDHESCGIRADHPMPSQAGIYYYEITIQSRRKDETSVCVGFMSKTASLARPPGWEPESWGFHGDDGEVYSGGNVGKKYSEPFGSGDIIGCGVNFRTGQAFFTKNGEFLRTAFSNIKGKVYPAIGVKKTGEHVVVNFGQTPFFYNIDKLVIDEQVKIRESISKTSIERLASPPMNETELIQQLVLQFLQHDGYVETAREFTKELLAEQVALKIDPAIPLTGISIQDDDDAHNRQRIRRAILEGDIDKAFKYTNVFYPHVLEENQDVFFRLKCRKFVEMIRKATEVGAEMGSRTNGHSYDDIPNKMDVDDNSLPDDEDDVEDADTQADANALLEETVRYGQALQAEYKNDPRHEISKTLNGIFGLMAFRNPLQVKEVAHLLDRKERANVAEELNSAILSSLGKSSRSALENLYGQTSVLLDYSREDGGPGSLISIQSVIEEIPKSQPF
ncbi:ran-binding protein [Xylariaceae sp. FL0255]|nr:ran-binding protein [Xylariaceae sp. FL0255]